MNRPFLEIKQASKIFHSADSAFTAVDQVSLSVFEGESIGIVGESGSGKSTLARMIMQLTKISSGNILVDGKDIGALNSADQKHIYSLIQMVFQEPFSALSPRMTIGDFLSSSILYFKKATKETVAARVAEVLALVDLPTCFADRLPHQLSGGQIQRVVIARTIAVEPKLIILDEATCALDVSVQAQILELLMALRAQFKLSYIFIGHDLAMVRSVTDRIVVMNRGKIVETLNSASIIKDAQDPYTKKLLSSVYSSRPKANDR